MGQAARQGGVPCALGPAVVASPAPRLSGFGQRLLGNRYSAAPLQVR